MNWKQTHPDHAVPGWLQRHESLRDESRAEDDFATFTDGDVTVWVEHIDPGHREEQDSHRFDVFAGEGAEQVSVVLTDDEVVAKEAVDWADGAMTVMGTDAFFSAYLDIAGPHYSDEGPLFLKDGRPRLPLEGLYPLVDLIVSNPSELKRRLVR